jgi:hypothetical protein
MNARLEQLRGVALHNSAATGLWLMFTQRQTAMDDRCESEALSLAVGIPIVSALLRHLPRYLFDCGCNARKRVH